MRLKNSIIGDALVSICSLYRICTDISWYSDYNKDMDVNKNADLLLDEASSVV
jgi:hypothetical protein